LGVIDDRRNRKIVDDNGDIPPRWRIPVQKLTGYVASGIALDPVHKEIILSAAGQRVIEVALDEDEAALVELTSY
jgi:hypothetical protein